MYLERGVDMIPPYLSERQVAEALNLSVRTLQRWRLEGRGPLFVRIGRAVRYPQSEIEKFLKSMLRQSTSDAAEER
jgi:excisionase family DNA binding protein